MLQPEPLGDRRRDERIGAGHQRQLVPAATVRVDQLECLVAQVRLDHLRQEAGSDGLQRGPVEAGQQTHLKGQVLLGIETAAAVVVGETADLRHVVPGVQAAGVHQEVRPCVGTVDRKERVVEVEQGQSHSSGILPACSRSQCRSKGTVSARPRCSA